MKWSLENQGKYGIYRKYVYIQWNLGNSNTNFSNLPDFSKRTEGPNFFINIYCKNITDFSNFNFSKKKKKINFSNRFVVPSKEIHIKIPG